VLRAPSAHDLPQTQGLGFDTGCGFGLELGLTARKLGQNAAYQELIFDAAYLLKSLISHTYVNFNIKVNTDVEFNGPTAKMAAAPVSPSS